MTMPAWWGERRFGLSIHASTAAVPAWAPIGEEASWYRSHVGDDVADVVLHPHPMVEALAHHRDRWGHLDEYDDVVALLTFDQFDAEAWASLARDAGAGYAIHVAKDHDGWTWWDAPGAEHTLTEVGPRRNVVAEFAAACERNDIVFGSHYSLLDWSDPKYPDEHYVDEVLHPQVVDLVERYGASMLWGDGQWAHDAGHWRTAELMRRVRAIDPAVVINDRWWASASDVAEDEPDIVRTFDGHPPAGITQGPWVFCRPIAQSFGANRNERSEHHLTGVEIIDLFTEVVSKGGHLQLGIGPSADGSISDLQAIPLRDAGRWIRTHQAMLASAAPWTTWGTRDVRYLRHGHDLIAIDVTGAGWFEALADSEHQVVSVVRIGAPEAEVTWMQDHSGLRIDPNSAPSSDAVDIAVYRIVAQPADQPNELFAPLAPEPTPLAPLVEAATPGSIVQLGDGTYLGPANVPAGVTVRGLGADRTVLVAPDSAATIVPRGPVVSVGPDARIEHLAVRETLSHGEQRGGPLVSVAGPAATVLGCTVAGSVVINADDALIRAVTCNSLIATNADRLQVSRCELAGNRWDLGIELRGGGGHLIESNRLTDHLCAVRAVATTGSTIRGNTIAAKWWGVHLDHAEDSRVHGNRVGSTMRAVDVDGGTQATVEGNAVTDGDSGCVVQDGASDCEVYGNHWDRCRIGLLTWEAGPVRHQDNMCSNLHDTDGAHITGP